MVVVVGIMVVLGIVTGLVDGGLKYVITLVVVADLYLQNKYQTFLSKSDLINFIFCLLI